MTRPEFSTRVAEPTPKKREEHDYTREIVQGRAFFHWMAYAHINFHTRRSSTSWKYVYRNDHANEITTFPRRGEAEKSRGREENKDS